MPDAPTIDALQVVRPAVGGMRRHVEMLCTGLADAGVRVAVASPLPLDVGAAPLHVVPIAASASPLADLRAALGVARVAREARLLHGHGLRGAWIASLAGALGRKPYVVTAHNLAPRRPGALGSRALRMTLRRARSVICVSGAVADSLRPWAGPACARAIVPNAVDTSPFDRAGPGGSPWDGSGPVVVALGRLSPEKGFDLFLEAAALLTDRCPEARFVLAGAGPEREPLSRRATGLGLHSRLAMPGHVEDPAALLLAADLVVVPSREEGQGLVALEAMAARRPVVAAAVGGLIETVRDGETGLLVAPEDAAALAEAVCALLGDPGRRAAMGRAGRAVVESQYTVARLVEGVLQAYRTCAGPGWVPGQGADGSRRR